MILSNKTAHLVISTYVQNKEKNLSWCAASAGDGLKLVWVTDGSGPYEPARCYNPNKVLTNIMVLNQNMDITSLKPYK